MKRKPVSRKDSIRFFALWGLAWVASFFLVMFAFVVLSPFSGQTTFLERLLPYVSAICVYAILQRHLTARYLGIELRHWLRWTLVGAVVGALCYEVLRGFVPPPAGFWWYARFDPPPGSWDWFVRNAYYTMGDFFRFGLAAVFQHFALPRQLPRRRLWLLGALLAGPFWHIHQILAALIQALAMMRVAAPSPATGVSQQMKGAVANSETLEAAAADRLRDSDRLGSLAGHHLERDLALTGLKR